jgi:hypothetical protein
LDQKCHSAAAADQKESSAACSIAEEKENLDISSHHTYIMPCAIEEELSLG